MKKTILSSAAMFAVITGIAVSGCKKEPVEIRVSSVSVSPSSLTLTEGEAGRFTATVSPEDADEKTVTWKSSATDIVSVGGDGSVTALKPGEATVTVTTKDGGKTANAKVTVRSKTVAVTGVSLDKTSLTLTEETSETLTATVSPEDATDKSVKWSSDKPEIASVDGSGKVSALKEGKAVVTVTTVDGGKTASCEVTVEPLKVTAVAVSLDKVTIQENKSFKLSAVCTPEEAPDKAVIWR